MVGPNAEPQAEVLGIKEKLTWCLDNLGQRITTAGLGLSDASTVRYWSRASVPPEDVGAQIDTLYGAAKRVADVYDNETARAFLRGPSPYAGDRSVLVFTAMAGVDETARDVVKGAVEAFLG